MPSPRERTQASRARADDLASTPLAQVLFELLEAEESGTLLIHGADDALYAAVWIERGYPCAALADDAGEHNLATLLLPILGWVEGRFEFALGQDLVGAHAALCGRVDPLPLIAAAARGSVPERWIERCIGRVDRCLIQASRRLDVGRYAFTPEERLVVAALAPGVVELEELRTQAEVRENVLRRVLYVLLLTRGISLVPKQRTVSGTITRSQPPPSALPAPSVRPRPSSSSAPRSLPPRSLPPRSLPPRSLPPTSLPPTSLSPTSYSQRPSLPVPPSAEDPRARRECAEGLWSKAEALANRGEFEPALQAARTAVKLCQPRPEHDAMLGWLILLHAGGDERVHPHVWRCLDRALKRDSLCEQVLFYKGLVLNLTGDLDQAHAYFQRILMLNPAHAGANREVHIYEMRKAHVRSESTFLRRLLTARRKRE